MSLLSLRAIGRRYGALQVVNNISFDVAAGEAVGVLGPNGAGKTTLMKLVAGTVSLSAGSIHFDGRKIDALRSEDRCGIGISRTSQVPQPFVGMTVWENVLTAACHGGHHDLAAAEEVAYSCLQRTGLLDRHGQLADALPLMGRKRLELARALACAPKLLLLDEIAGGLSDFEVKDLVALVRDINESGVAVVWIEHIVHALLSVVSRVVAMDLGNLIADGTPDEVINGPAFKQAYFGDKIATVGMA
ncbi:ATP-binding cassette domain-containing protein [Devosia sp.]|uniref:ABC transporter ATP-binding protein n=1 Tax=Devosia sp. TaxID=1871048 RepID=UPI002637DABE|nr:ATP-binding cassette domain-containing protein [Devosia sp.]